MVAALEANMKVVGQLLAIDDFAATVTLRPHVPRKLSLLADDLRLLFLEPSHERSF